MASIYKRGQNWWVKFHHRGKAIRKPLKTSNRQLARERARLLESSMKDGCFATTAACTRTTLALMLEEFCGFLRTTKTRVMGDN